MNDFVKQFENIENQIERIKAIVKVIKEIPWGKARTCDEVLTKNVGTCTGKHKLLEETLRYFNIPCESVVCTFQWEKQGLKLPNNLQAILDEGSWEHGHNWVKLVDRKIDIDLTWDSVLAPYGFPVIPDDWDGETSFIGLKSFEQKWEGVSIDEMKETLVGMLSPEQKERRERFVEGLIEWSNELHRNQA